ncbi:hypothetical protein J21TS7_20030 [Paenibacillus cineris]|uniref:Spore coat associated protein JA (CotJA) n=1 Tax=Paenibacillus cineris TaxID=237530 RepID=A0ABQ4LBN9_9BACL|nr:hypothetical protein J21TS7_20030 [Paenibacillus cineris]
MSCLFYDHVYAPRENSEISASPYLLPLYRIGPENNVEFPCRLGNDHDFFSPMEKTDFMV